MRDTATRFAAKVDKSAGADGCWLWTGALNSDGYPIFASKSSQPIKLVLAHRFAWEMANGREVPAGLQVMHACDVRACVNPAHLSPGSARDNAQDAVRKGRFRGMANAPGIGKHTHRSPRRAA